MRLPTKFYRVVVIRNGEALPYWQSAGKTYASISAAEERIYAMEQRGIKCELYESEPVEWHKVSTGSDS